MLKTKVTTSFPQITNNVYTSIGSTLENFACQEVKRQMESLGPEQALDNMPLVAQAIIAGQIMAIENSLQFLYADSCAEVELMEDGDAVISPQMIELLNTLDQVVAEYVNHITQG